jgi:hypothetical protein
MDSQANNSPLALVTGAVNLPGITVLASTQQYRLYEQEETVLGVFIECRAAADALNTDAQVDAEITAVEVWDGDIQIVRPMTPALLRAMASHYLTWNAAWPADSGVIPLLLTPPDYPLSLTRARFGLGRAGSDGKPRKLKIQVTYAAAVPTVVTVIPTVIFDPTEKLAPLGRHFRMDLATYTETGTGERRIIDLLRDTNAVSVKELLFNTAVGTFVNVTVRQGNEMRYYQTRPTILNAELRKAGLTAIAGRQSVLFNTLNDASSQLTLAGKPPVDVTVNWSVAPGASDVVRVMEYDGLVSW